MFGNLKKKLKSTRLYPVYKWVKSVPKRIDRRWNKFYTLRILYPGVYKKYAKLPVDENKIVFIEIRLPELTNSFKLLYDELVTDYDFTIHSHFLRTTFVSRQEFRRRCCDMMRDIATAKYVFMNEASNVVSCVDLRPETVITQLWHGCGAFKKFGLSTADLIFGDNRKEMMKYPFNRNYTNVTVSSPEVIWAYEEAMGLENQKGVVKAVGSSRTDVFYDEDFNRAAMERVHELMPESIGKKIILYAPTFRGRVATAKTPNMLNVRMFADALSDEYVLIFKHHPLVRKPPVIPDAYSHFAKDFTDAMSIEELLAVSDVCISDYSSLVFEYSLYEKPLIFFAYDLSEFFDWRGFYYDYKELTPGPIFTTNLEMIDYIQNLDTRFDKEQVVAFRKKFMSSCDGHATERIIKLALGDAAVKNKRAVPIPSEPYHLLPNASLEYGQKWDRLDRLKEMTQDAMAIYAEAAKEPVKKGYYIFLGSGMSPAFISLQEKMQQKGLAFETILEPYDYKETAKKLAVAAAVFLSETVDLINVLDMRKETQVVQLNHEALPIDRFDYASISYQAGFSREYEAMAPLHRNYTIVPVASEFAGACYREAYRLENPQAIRVIGSGNTDRFFDAAYKQTLLDRLHKIFPESVDKKIIFYYPKERMSKLRPKHAVFLDHQLVQEYLRKDYVMVYMYCAPKGQMPAINIYYKEFMLNMNRKKDPIENPLTVQEMLTIADIVIGDYNMEVFDFLASSKPIFFYTPDQTFYGQLPDSFIDYQEITQKFTYTDTMELVRQICDLEHYDYESLAKLREKYFAVCDGKASERLLELLEA